ncbi:helix-turn-helix transcriptional regulator [Actinocorallia sp. API 0066]|uniref:helix-turn-helix domain-containing protein n=1 Tax=Actinocorallia sp. API 0066 TaxID=2896846 RepID=UPI001E56040F|nr:helix-turn-helix transcriptional regulator [Actinocorallia sp. API 0066]MCD0451470.1 helix-turn-helix transcriptional regulator [Actinocorallia sp. API 0066]
MGGTVKGRRLCPACRYTQLSRYNPDPLCAVCLTAARAHRQGPAPTWLWDSAPLRGALARADMAAVVAIVRGACAMSQLEFGEVVGWSQSVVTKVERGERRTAYDISEILNLADALGMPRETLIPLVLGRADATPSGQDEDDARMFWGGEDEDVKRRHFGQAALGTTVAAVLPPPPRVDRGHLRYLHTCLDRLRGTDASAGGAGVLGESISIYRRARAMLDESDYNERTGRELLTVTADLAIVSGWLAYDADNQGLARGLYEQADQLAAASDVPSIQIHVAVNLAQQSTHLAAVDGQRGHARAALRFADRAARAARHEASSSLHALIALRQALAHARLGDRIAFGQAIGLARRELDREQGDHPPWTRFVTHSEVTGYQALGAEALGGSDRSVNLYLDVLADDRRSPRDLAVYRACLAGALCSAGDVTGAVKQGLQVLSAPAGSLRSARVLRTLAPLRTSTEDEEFTARYDAAVQTFPALTA